MALFTISDATGCTITLCSSNKIDGVHQYYMFGVLDDNTKYYEWSDSDSPTGLTTTQVKDVIRTTLLTMDKIDLAPTITTDNDTDIVGDLVGD